MLASFVEHKQARKLYGCKVRHKKNVPDGLERFGKDLGRIWETHSSGRPEFPSSSASFSAISRHWENMPWSFLLTRTISIRRRYLVHHVVVGHAVRPFVVALPIISIVRTIFVFINQNSSLKSFRLKLFSSF